MANETIPTGIVGLDKILNGGLRERSSVLIAGPPGTGKTILALQFIVEGARRGEGGIYITPQKTPYNLPP